jgi:ATP-dependent protease HslVU (ClpYQ) peptidase subunit
VTCIVGIANSDGVWIGADSITADTSQWLVRQERFPKVFRLHDKMIIGFTSSWRMGQLLRWSLKTPDRNGTPADEWLATVFIDAVRATLKAGGMAKKENEVEQGGSFLVAYDNRLWQVEGDYQVGEPAEGYASVGCGRDYALGVLHATSDLLMVADPRQRLERALSAAAYHSAYVRPPFQFLKL